MRPIARTAHVSVFDGIVMDVVQMTPQIRWIADGVFPEAALPYTPRAVLQPRGRGFLLDTTCFEIASREIGFEVVYADREIGIVLWKSHDKVQMIGEQDDGIDDEVVIFPALLERTVKNRPR